jgi:phosphoribosylformylglycinamidine cyclo-ligase
LQQAGGVEPPEMFRTFNMGVGMVVITDDSSSAEVLAAAAEQGVRAWRMGRVRKGSGQVILT